MPKEPFYAVVETWEDGVGVYPYKNHEAAVKRFEAILEENFFSPNWTRARINKELEVAKKNEYYSVCDRDAVGFQSIQIKHLSFED